MHFKTHFMQNYEKIVKIKKLFLAFYVFTHLKLYK